MRKLFIFFAILFSNQSFASLFLEMDGLYLTDTFTTSTTASNSKTFYSFDIYANLDSKKTLLAGFHVDQLSFIESPTSTTTYTLTSQNMGLMGMWVIGKNGTYSLSGGYSLVANGSYAITGSSTATLTGTSIWSSFGVMPEVAENLYMGFKILYYSVSYSKSTVSTTASDVSYNRTFILPIFGLSWRY